MYKSQFPIRRFNAKTSALFIVHLDNSTWIKTLKNCEKDLALVLHNSCSETLLSISSHAYRSHMCFNSDRCSCATVLFSFYPKGWCSGRYMTFEPLRLFNISSCIQFPEWFRIILWCMYKTLKKLWWILWIKNVSFIVLNFALYWAAFANVLGRHEPHFTQLGYLFFLLKAGNRLNWVVLKTKTHLRNISNSCSTLHLWSSKYLLVSNLSHGQLNILKSRRYWQRL